MKNSKMESGQQLVLIFLIMCINLFAAKLMHFSPTISREEDVFFKSHGWFSMVKPMHFGGWTRFSPFCYGPIGKFFVDFRVMSHPGFLVFFHFLLSGIYLVFALFVAKQIKLSSHQTYALLILLGLSCSTIFQFNFVSTYAIYFLQIETLFFIWVIKTFRTRTFNRNIFFISVDTILALGTWEQGVNLACAVICIFLIRFKLEREARKKYAVVCLVEGIILVVYLLVRSHGVTSEVLNRNSEAAFVFNYSSIFPMIDDIWLNFLGYTNALISQVIPFHALLLSSIIKYPVTQINVYNQNYSQFPGASYQYLDLWVSGFCFAIFLYLVFVWKKLIFLRNYYDLIIIFFFGYLVSLPMMFRDYLFLTHYSVGYKVAISQVAFGFLIVLAFQGVNKLSRILFCFGIIRIIMYILTSV